MGMDLYLEARAEDEERGKYLPTFMDYLIRTMEPPERAAWLERLRADLHYLLEEHPLTKSPTTLERILQAFEGKLTRVVPKDTSEAGSGALKGSQELVEATTGEPVHLPSLVRGIVEHAFRAAGVEVPEPEPKPEPKPGKPYPVGVLLQMWVEVEARLVDLGITLEADDLITSLESTARQGGFTILEIKPLGSALGIIPRLTAPGERGEEQPT